MARHGPSLAFRVVAERGRAFSIWGVMKISSILNRKVQLELGAAVLILLALGAISYRAMVKASEASQWVQHTHAVINNLQDLLLAMESVESSYNGYVLTGKESYFKSYRASISSAEQDVASVHNLTLDNPDQQRLLSSLQRVAAEKIQFAEMVSGVRRDQGFAAASELLGHDEGLRLMNEIRSLTAEMETEEKSLLEARTAQWEANAGRARLVIRLGWLLALFFLVAASRIVYRDITERVRTEETLGRLAAIVESTDDAILSKDLEGIIQSWNAGAERLYGYSQQEAVGQSVNILVPTGSKDANLDVLTRMASGERIEHYETRRRRKDGVLIDVSLTVSPIKDSAGEIIGASTIARNITEPKRQEAEIRDLNRDLSGRMADLETANHELEAFTYSVSHDLRAPLRHISGFSNILREEYGPQLDQTGQHYLERIRVAATKMGCLVDDLLNLSRLGRRELNRQPANLSSLVEEVLANLRQDLEGRKIEWRIAQLPFANCDAALMRQVFENLIANAIKFTRPRQPAVIEIGQKTIAEESVFFVCDNGVDFNMKYTDKLFGVFQRLHRAEDFEGTGVGLATVQRIIHKHGGRIWAEAELDKGATFYFTLGPDSRVEEPALSAALVEGVV